MRRVWLALAGILLAGPVTAQDEEPLEPEKAFAFNARATAADHIEARWEIASGYYMYRDKIHFEINASGASLGSVQLPPGKEKHDEFFGDISIFQKELVVSLPIERIAGGNAATPLTVELVARSQGCNEPLGVCYPPLTQTRTLQLAAFEGQAGPAAGQPAGKIQKITALRDLLNQPAAGGAGPENEFLEPDKAFALTYEVLDGSRVRLQVDIAEGYYLYRDKFKLESRSGSVRVAPIRMPAGKKKHDEFFGDVEVYYSRVAFEVPLLRAAIEATDLSLAVEYQGCADAGICYPPIKKTLELKLPAAVAVSTAADAIPAGPKSGLQVEADQGLFWALLGAFGVGLLLTFTPCVLPMIPILSGIIVGQGPQVSRLRGGILSAVYVLGTAITYMAVGIFAGYTGEQLQAYVQNIWAIGFFVLVLVALALSMFGFFEIQMPSAIQSRLQERSQGLKGGTFVGVLVMGMVSAL
ncbi:MAG: thiol:disulfide interchange protein, partial [Gammaproteobacteria bacterium]|nr:thiol:disulfide interchange protein [Gammaproteobacteria bacterium]